MTSVPDYRVVGQRTSTEFTLSGLDVLVDELKLVHLFDLLELLEKTSMSVNLSPDQDVEVFSNSLVAAIAFSAADNQADLSALLRAVLRPASLVKNPKTSDAKQINEALWTQLYDELEDPDIEDLIDVVKAIVHKSADTIIALGRLDQDPEPEEDEEVEDERKSGASYTPETIPNFAGRELLGGFSRALDLISSEYHWVDEQILDLSLTRFRQIFAAIKERKWGEALQRKELSAWQIRTVCEFIACTVPFQGEEGEEVKNPLLHAARFIGLNSKQRKELLSFEEDEPVDDGDVYVDPETGETTRLRKNNNIAAISMFNTNLDGKTRPA